MKKNVLFTINVAQEVANDERFIDALEAYIDDFRDLCREAGLDFGVSAEVQVIGYFENDVTTQMDYEYYEEEVDIEDILIMQCSDMALQDVNILTEVAHKMSGKFIVRYA